jgi:hypothetical protein
MRKGRIEAGQHKLLQAHALRETSDSRHSCRIGSPQFDQFFGFSLLRRRAHVSQVDRSTLSGDGKSLSARPLCRPVRRFPLGST